MIDDACAFPAATAVAPLVSDAELTAGLEAQQFRLLYQPTVSLLTDRIVGVEALLRFDHRRHGELAAEQFMRPPTAPDLVVAIGTWAMREACRQAAEWVEQHPGLRFTMSIDVPADSFRGDLPDVVRAAIRDAGLDPRVMCLEFTEQALFADVEETSRILCELRTIGSSASIDDFGSGRSCLESLVRMPVDRIKIPSSYIADPRSPARDAAIVGAVIGLAHSMGFTVVARGVDSEEQLAKLRSLGCDVAQGDRLGEPVVAAEIAAIFEAAAAGTTPPRRRAAHDRTSAPAPRALIIDASADSRLVASSGLLAAGFVVDEADRGRAGLAAARGQRHDLILVDVDLPDLRGIDVCKVLRGSPDTSSCTIVMFTTSNDSADKAESFLVGADDYVLKPSRPLDLADRVHGALLRRTDAPSPIVPVDPALLQMLRPLRDRSLSNAVSRLMPLSGRQLEILERLLEGDRVPAIARDLYVSASTVRNHLSTIFRKLGVHSQEELLSLLHSIRRADEHVRSPVAATESSDRAGPAPALAHGQSVRS